VRDHTEHQRITQSGWAYRMNDRGWVIYRDPQTSLWHTQSEATLVIKAQAVGVEPSERPSQPQGLISFNK